VVIGNGIISNKVHSASEAPALGDQKDAEIDREETVEEEEKAEIETGNTETGPSKHRLVVSEEPTEQATLRGLSLRASRMGEYLRASKEVTALILRADGSAKEISYDASASQTRTVLDGSASIVGSIEGLDAIIVRAQSSSGERNEHSLPGDVEGGHRGDYLIFRADAEGNAANLSLSEYQLFAAANPSSNQRSADRIDAQNIHARPKASNLVFVRSEIDRVVRAELKDSSATETEIATAKAQRFQSVVDGVVAELASSPMSDPDFDESAAAEGEAERAVDAQIQTDDASTDSRHWRLQLGDAMRFVRARGRADGQRLAQQISSTFFELNAKQPSQEELTDIFGGIKAELAAEAQRDLSPEQRVSADTHSASNSVAQRLAPKLSTASASELVEYGRAIVEQDLVQRARSLLRSVLGREGDDSEVRETLKDLALKLAEAALDANARGAKDRSDDDGDSADYNPENAADSRLHRHDAKEDREHNAEHFEGDRSGSATESSLTVRTSATNRSRTGAAESYSVYFSETSKRSNLPTALRMFQRRNDRAPTQIEQARIRQFLATQEIVDVVSVVDGDRDGAESEDREISNLQRAQEKERKLPRSPQKVLVTPIRTSKAKAAAFNVYFERSKLSEAASQSNERTAVQWFKRFNDGRAPTDAELNRIRSFTKTDANELTEQEYVVPTYSLSGCEDTDANDDEETAQRLTAAKSSGLVTKQSATSYTLQFDGDAVGDEKVAAQWFARFNKREPTDEDRARIASFLGGNGDDEAEETIDID